jgi:hypothetical protein
MLTSIFTRLLWSQQGSLRVVRLMPLYCVKDKAIRGQRSRTITDRCDSHRSAPFSHSLAHLRLGQTEGSTTVQYLFFLSLLKESRHCHSVADPGTNTSQSQHFLSGCRTALTRSPHFLTTFSFLSLGQGISRNRCNTRLSYATVFILFCHLFLRG